MTDAEKKALLMIVKDIKNMKSEISEMKESVDYLVEATELLVKIQTEQIKGK